MRASISTLILISLLSGCGATPQPEVDRPAPPAIRKVPEVEVDHPANPALHNLILVRAKVTSIDKVTANRSRATLEVVHVYHVSSGRAGLMGRSFRDTQMFENMGGSPAHARFEIGEEGIWVLRDDQDGLRPTDDDRLPFRYRSRKADSPENHPRVVALAETVETYAKAKPEDRPVLAETLARNGTALVSYWMVGTLADTDEPFAGELLAEWRKNPAGLPFLGQIALDKVLCARDREARDREEWFSAPERAKLLVGWVSEKRPDLHPGSVVSRLDSATQEGALREDRLLELVRIAASNKDWGLEDRRGAIGLLARRRKTDPRPTYDWLFDQIKTHPDVDMRTMAAGVLGGLGFDEKWVRAVEDYLATEKDASIVKALRDAVKWAKDAATRAKEAENKN